MTKTVCDICGKDIEPIEIEINPIKERDFCIVSYGSVWDICPICRRALLSWINSKRE